MKINYYLELTLFEMLKTHSIDDIYTIDIINKTGTCKGTFYKYYCDKYDLLISCMKNFIYCGVEQNVEWSEFIGGMLKNFQSNIKASYNSLKSVDACSGRYFNNELICKFIADKRKNTNKEFKGFLIENAIKVYAANITDYIVGWLHDGCKTSSDNVLKLINSIEPIVLKN